MLHMRRVRNLRRVVIPHLRSQRRHQHQRILHIPLHLRPIHFNPLDHVLDISMASVRHQRDRVQKVINDHRLVHVQLKVPLRSRHADRRRRPMHLHAHHRHRFALRGIHLPRHDRRSRLILRNHQLAQPAPRPRSQPPYIVRDLHQRSRQSFHRPLRKHNLIVRRKRRKLIRMRPERKSRQLRNLLRRPLRKFGMRIQPRPHRRPANRQIVQPIQHHLQPLDVAIEQRSPAAKFLSNGQGHSVLQMRAPNLHHRVKFLSLRRNRIPHRLDRRNQKILHPFRRRNMHRRRKRIVRRLRHIHMIVRMHRLLRSHLSARNLNRAIRDDLIHIHIGLRARPRLPNPQRKLVIQLPRNHFVRRQRNELRLIRSKFAQILIHQRASLLQRAKSPNQLRRHDIPPNIKMQKRALRLRPPVNIGGNFDLPHAVRLNAGLGLSWRNGFSKSSHDDLLCASDIRFEAAPPLRLLQGWVMSTPNIKNRLLYGGGKGKSHGAISLPPNLSQKTARMASPLCG